MARRDVDDIYDYIGQRDGRPTVADEFVRQLEEVCDEYAAAFAAGHVLGTDRSDLGESYRAISHKRWVIIFRPIYDGIEVMRVVDGSRDYGRLFGG
jgi:plasmid stabilization system protein ParE